MHQHEQPQQLQGENSQPSLPGHPSENRVVSVRVSHCGNQLLTRPIGVKLSHVFYTNCQSLTRQTLRPSTYLELRVVCENGLRELGEHVAGAEYTRVSKRSDRRVTSSNLRQLTRTPFFAHSTAREAAMCFTATRIERK